MALVKAICTHCGGVLDVDNEKDAWVCKYCNTPFIVEKAVNIYNTNTTVKAEHVDYYGGKASMEELIQRADAFLVVKDYAKLQNVYEEMTESYPTRYEGWWGMITIITEDFTDFRIFSTGYKDYELYREYHNLTKNEFEKLEKISSMMKLCKQYAPADVYKDLDAKYTPYINTYKEKLYSFHTEKLIKLIGDAQNAVKSKSESYHSSLNNQINNCQKSITIEKNALLKRNIGLIVTLVMILLAVISFASGSILGGIGVLFFLYLLILYGFSKSFSRAKGAKKRITNYTEQLQSYQAQLAKPFSATQDEAILNELKQELAQLEQRINSIQ